jgi:hypothetical protein
VDRLPPLPLLLLLPATKKTTSNPEGFAQGTAPRVRG